MVDERTRRDVRLCWVCVDARSVVDSLWSKPLRLDGRWLRPTSRPGMLGRVEF